MVGSFDKYTFLALIDWEHITSITDDEKYLVHVALTKGDCLFDKSQLEQIDQIISRVYEEISS